MKKNIIWLIIVILTGFVFFGCKSGKNSPFYDTEWLMQNVDANNQPYYHHLIFQPENRVMLRVSYFDSTNIIVWRGTYKIKSNKLVLNFEDCSRFENGENVGQYSDKRLIYYYKGDYYYSLGLIGDTEEDKVYHLQLIRPENIFYGETKDIYGNYFEDFVKIDNLTKAAQSEAEE